MTDERAGQQDETPRDSLTVASMEHARIHQVESYHSGVAAYLIGHAVLYPDCSWQPPDLRAIVLSQTEGSRSVRDQPDAGDAAPSPSSGEHENNSKTVNAQPSSGVEAGRE